MEFSLDPTTQRKYTGILPIVVLALLALVAGAFGLSNPEHSLAVPALVSAGLVALSALVLVAKGRREANSPNPANESEEHSNEPQPAQTRHPTQNPAPLASANETKRAIVLLCAWAALCVVAVVAVAWAYAHPAHPFSTPTAVLGVLLIVPFMVNRFRSRRLLRKTRELRSRSGKRD